MRTLKITVALAAIACVAVALASPALAKEKTKAFFGEFHANVPSGAPVTPSTPAIAKTKEGSLDAMYLGGKEGAGPFTFECGSLSSEGKVESESSETFRTEIKFKKCTAQRNLVGPAGEKGIPVKFTKGFEMEFHANGSAELTHIVKGTETEIKVKGGACNVIIPEQRIGSENFEKESEASEFGKEFEKWAPQKLKTFPNGFQYEMFIEWHNKLTYWIPVEKNGACFDQKESTDGKFNPELNVIEYNGYFEGELEEIKVKKGNVWFESARERKEIEEKGECAATHSCV